MMPGPQSRFDVLHAEARLFSTHGLVISDDERDAFRSGPPVGFLRDGQIVMGTKK